MLPELDGFKSLQVKKIEFAVADELGILDETLKVENDNAGTAEKVTYPFEEICNES